MPGPDDLPDQPFSPRGSLPDSMRSSKNLQPHLYVTILAGGTGRRFWPLSIPARPKQLLPLASSRPLIVDTFERARNVVSEERIRILTGQALAPSLRELLPEASERGLMIEPEARGTAPVLTWAAWEIATRDPEAVLISLHADHIIHPEESLVEVLHSAAALATREDLLFTVAVQPTRPETGYGYIEPGEAIEEAVGVRAFRVASFSEKPDPETADRYLSSGHLWNSGIFVWKAATFLEEVRAVAPEIANHLALLDENRVEEFFTRTPVMTVDVAVLERSRRVASVAATFEWDDVGSWEALTRSRKADRRGNFLIGSGHMVESSHNVVYSGRGTVVAYGIDDLLIVQAPEVTLVTRRDFAPKLKELVESLPGPLRDGLTLPEEAEGE